MTFTYTYQLFTPSGALAARIHRHIEDLVTPQPTVVVTGSWLTVEEQMPTGTQPRSPSAASPPSPRR
jgi:hypothetical protein